MLRNYWVLAKNAYEKILQNRLKVVAELKISKMFFFQAKSKSFALNLEKRSILLHFCFHVITKESSIQKLAYRHSFESKIFKELTKNNLLFIKIILQWLKIHRMTVGYFFWIDLSNPSFVISSRGREFIFVMKNRVQRGFRQVRGSEGGWDGFTACVRSQLKNG